MPNKNIKTEKEEIINLTEDNKSEKDDKSYKNSNEEIFEKKVIEASIKINDIKKEVHKKIV
jgi:hypothetical protein